MMATTMLRRPVAITQHRAACTATRCSAPARTVLPTPPRPPTAPSSRRPLAPAASLLSSRPASASSRSLALRVRRPVRLVARASRAGTAVSVQANLFSRVYRLVTSFFTNLVSSYEDPEKLLDKVVEEMQDDIVRVRQATAQVTASQRQLSAKHTNLQSAADQWLQRAELAVSRGQDDLAREALKRRKVLQEDADRMLQQVQLQAAAGEQLTANLRFLEGKLGEARSKKETLKARAASAKTSAQIQEMIGGLRTSKDGSWAAFDRMEEKVAALEAQAQTAAALSAPDSLERQFVALEGDTGVEAELAALKGGNFAGGRRQLTAELPGRPLSEFFPTSSTSTSDAISRELEELRRRARE